MIDKSISDYMSALGKKSAVVRKKKYGNLGKYMAKKKAEKLSTAFLKKPLHKRLVSVLYK